MKSMVQAHQRKSHSLHSNHVIMSQNTYFLPNVSHRVPLFLFFFFLFFFFFFFPLLFRAEPVEYGSSTPTPQLQQHWRQAASVTYITACSNVRSLAHLLRPGVESKSSQTFCLVLNLLKHNGNSYCSSNV